MDRQKLCAYVSGLNMPAFEWPLALKRAGFDGFFIGYENRGTTLRYAEIAAQESLMLQSVHAPYTHVDAVWKNGEKGEAYIKHILECVDATADAGATIVVMHVWIGFDKSDMPNRLGLQRLERVVERAEKRGVRIAFENTEGDAFLSAVMTHFKPSPAVGFCWDTGHELCYNRGIDQTALYGDRLIMTHINDNLGISDVGGHIFWTDDLHLMPFDGITDWQSVAERLRRCNFSGPLTFELTRKSKPGRHDNDKYETMSAEEYLAELYTRACRLSEMLLK